MNIGILGTGEVGSAVKKIVNEKHRVFTANTRQDFIKNRKITVLHICIPYDNQFVKIAVQAIKKYNPLLTIIESTVAPGTTDSIFRQTKKLICHSPIRGSHPDLSRGIKTFVKYIGPASKKAGTEAARYYEGLGLKTEICTSARTTEIAKLMDTTYYGWNIIFQKEIEKICKTHGIPFAEAYTSWNVTYNQGYKKLGEMHVIRPVLRSVKGKIGGHCVIPNCEILERTLSNPLSQTILKLNKNY